MYKEAKELFDLDLVGKRYLWSEAVELELNIQHLHFGFAFTGEKYAKNWSNVSHFMSSLISLIDCPPFIFQSF